MEKNSQLVTNTTQQLSQNDEVESNSGNVALAMGAFSIVLLIIISLVLSIFHSLFIRLQ
jgi:hypothetical protein